MENRVPRYPGRVRLVPVPGQSGLYDMVRADEPTVAGTPLNKETLLTDETANLLELPSAKTTVNYALQRCYLEGKSVTVPFSSGEWRSSGSGVQLTISASKHLRENGRFCHIVRQSVGGKMKATTWAAITTQVAYDGSSQNITLWSESAFDGEIIVTG